MGVPEKPRIPKSDNSLCSTPCKIKMKISGFVKPQPISACQIIKNKKERYIKMEMEINETLLGKLKQVKRYITNIVKVTERQVNIVASFRESAARFDTDSNKSKVMLAVVILCIASILFTGLILRDWSSVGLLVACAGILYWKRGKKSRLKIVAVVLLAMYAINFVLGTIEVTLAGNFVVPVVAVLLCAGALFAVKYAIKVHNNAVDKRNAEIEQGNAQLQMQYDETVAELKQLKQELAAYGKGWYPADYYSLDAVNFFISAVANLRATNMQQAILRFDEAQYKQKMLDSQQQIVALNKQQVFNQKVMIGCLTFANVLQMQNLSLQHQQLNATRANTTATNNAASAVRNLIDKL